MEQIKDTDPDFADIQMKKTLSQKLNNKTLEGVEEFWCTVEHIDLPKSYWEYYMACAEDWNNIEGLPEGRKNKTYLDYLFNYLKLQTIYTEELEDIGVTKKGNTTKLCQRTIKIACDNNT
ncbi:unnamed protein product [Moneuplotes crassus]|uniref:Uncharacterized protein n=1 Tax=Euplotes crassus TaxID=5936 RepID=A0AAD1Y350_EUPCR|nr:unnamed protein product [Moneuplotes crassus]